MKKIVAFIYCVFIVFSLLHAQDQTLSTHNKKAAKLFEDASHYYDSHQNENAMGLLLKAIKEDSNFVEAQGMLGYVYDDMGRYEQAIHQYSEVIRINQNFFSNIFFDIGKLEVKMEKYDDAKTHLEYFLHTGKGDYATTYLAGTYLADCNFAIEAKKHPVPFSPLNMGPAINTKLDEYFPTMTVDGSLLIFTRLLYTPETPGPEGDHQEDFYVSHKVDGDWTKAMNAGPQLNTEYNEGASTISADGNTLIFASDREGGHGSCDLYYSFRIGNSWSMARNMGSPVNTRNWETQPSLASDGRTLYFIRGLEIGHQTKEQHIYVTTLDDSSYWSVPVKLSDTINSQGMEQSPFISADNQTLYFCSDGHPGMGGLDIFMSRRLPNGRWGMPVNMGYPINTPKDESGISIDPNGKLAYLSSDRTGGYGGQDIYSFVLPDSLRPQPVTYLKGKVFDANTKAPLIAYFTLIDLTTGKVVSENTSKPGDGTFLVCLPVNKNYALNVSKKGYLFYSENFSLKDVKATYEHPFLKDVPLQPIDTGASIVLKNVFFETNKYDLKPESEVELNKLVTFLKNNPTIKIQISGHTDNQGTPQSNITLSENRAKSVYTYLISHAIDAARLTYKGYGQTIPIASNDTPEGRQLNRRTEMKITGK